MKRTHRPALRPEDEMKGPGWKSSFLDNPIQRPSKHESGTGFLKHHSDNVKLPGKRGCCGRWWFEVFRADGRPPLLRRTSALTLLEHHLHWGSAAPAEAREGEGRPDYESTVGFQGESHVYRWEPAQRAWVNHRKEGMRPHTLLLDVSRGGEIYKPAQHLL